MIIYKKINTHKKNKVVLSYSILISGSESNKVSKSIEKITFLIITIK